MPTFEIICLANSIKYGGRCIAGFKTDGSGWIRPVSPKIDGTLYPEHYQLSNGEEPQLFSLLKIEFRKHHPQCHQPENWVINERKWQHRGFAKLEQLNHLLANEIYQASHRQLLGNASDRWKWDDLQNHPISASLCLIRPKNLRWKIFTSRYRRKYRAIFTLHEVEYDLGVTDPSWMEIIEQLDDGEYPAHRVIEELNLENFDPERFLFTISLSGPFQPPGETCDFCFKLVATVINSKNVRTFLE